MTAKDGGQIHISTLERLTSGSLADLESIVLIAYRCLKIMSSFYVVIDYTIETWVGTETSQLSAHGCPERSRVLISSLA